MNGFLRESSHGDGTFQISPEKSMFSAVKKAANEVCVLGVSNTWFTN
jgi:hypothetical protein